MSCLYSITGIERDGSIIVNMLVLQDQLQKKKKTALAQVLVLLLLISEEKWKMDLNPTLLEDCPVEHISFIALTLVIGPFLLHKSKAS